MRPQSVSVWVVDEGLAIGPLLGWASDGGAWLAGDALAGAGAWLTWAVDAVGVLGLEPQEARSRASPNAHSGPDHLRGLGRAM